VELLIQLKNSLPFFGISINHHQLIFHIVDPDMSVVMIRRCGAHGTRIHHQNAIINENRMYIVSSNAGGRMFSLVMKEISVSLQRNIIKGNYFMDNRWHYVSNVAHLPVHLIPFGRDYITWNPWVFNTTVIIIFWLVIVCFGKYGGNSSCGSQIRSK
jgi:hypothetical protein